MAITDEDVQKVLEAIRNAQKINGNRYRFLRLRFEDGRERDYLCTKRYQVPTNKIIELVGKKGTVIRDYEEDITKTGIAIGLYRWLD